MQADAPQAYIQTALLGTETWICLPPEARPDTWKGKYRFPMVKLKKALYGHPDAGTYWEKHCDERVRKAGWEPLPPEWPSCYFQKKLRMFMIIYVDDFKMAGPNKHFAEAWKGILATGIKLDEPGDLDHFLGCRHV